jgi:hypothetical protein
MELLLNLAWVLLALPAYWLWQECRAPESVRRFSSGQCLLALGCMLVVLFPVVSATDDLRALCTAIEESPISKRSVRQSGPERPAAPQDHGALVTSFGFSPSQLEFWYQAPSLSRVLPSIAVHCQFGRAPPESILA